MYKNSLFLEWADTTVEISTGDSDIEIVQIVEPPEAPVTSVAPATPNFLQDFQGSPASSCGSSSFSAAARIRRGGWKRKRGSRQSGHSVFKRRSTRLIPGFHMEDPEAFGPLTTKPVSLSEHLRSYMPAVFARQDGWNGMDGEESRAESSFAESEGHQVTFFDDIFTKDDALAFLESHKEKDSVVNLVWTYLIYLRKRASCDYRWSESLRATFLQCYHFLAKCSQLTTPAIFEQDPEMKDIENERCREEGYVRLLYAEFMAWKGYDEEEREKMERLRGHLIHISSYGMVFGNDKEEWSKFRCRVEWMNANMQEMKKNYGGPHFGLDFCLYMLETDLGGRPVPLEHCEATISETSLKQRMERLERAEQFDQIEEIFERGEFQAVIDVLTPHLCGTPLSKSEHGIGMDRLRQYEILLTCFRVLERAQDVPATLVRALKWSLLLYARLDLEEKKKWWTVMGNILSIGEWAFFGTNTSRCVEILDSVQRHSLCNSLIDLVVLIDDCPLKKEDIPNWCWLSPWNILYQINRHLEMGHFDEAYAKAWYEKANSSTVILATRSLMIWWRCHQEMGRRKLCMSIRAGGFLTYVAEEILRTLRHPVVAKCIPSSCMNDTLNCAEQCFYCLYKYPSKKKRHLDEHDATPVELDWSKAVLLFDFVRPDQAPEFDDHPHATAVTADSAQLLHKIELMVPKMLRPGKRILFSCSASST